MITIPINERVRDRSQLWLARTSQINYSVVRNLARQKSQRISYSTLTKLCDAPECEPADLLMELRKLDATQ